VRIDRAVQTGEVDLEAWQADMVQQFQAEIAIHFAAEEKELFPVAQHLPGLKPLVDELLGEHAVLRNYFALAAGRKLDVGELHTFAGNLSTHIRKEERQLFETLQKSVPPAEMAALGAKLEKALKDAAQACALPNPATVLRPRSDP
jgi:hemerythrin-like domain-containing protein